MTKTDSARITNIIFYGLIDGPISISYISHCTKLFAEENLKQLDKCLKCGNEIFTFTKHQDSTLKTNMCYSLECNFKGFSLP